MIPLRFSYVNGFMAVFSPTKKMEIIFNDRVALLYCLMVIVCLPGVIRNSVDLSTLLLSPSIVLNYLRSISATKDI